MKTSIRDFTMADVETLRYFYSLIDKQHYQYCPELIKKPEDNLRNNGFFESILGTSGKGILVAEIDNEGVVGFLEYEIRKRDKRFFEKINMFYICTLFVLENFRGQGIGRELFKMSCDIAEKSKISSIELVTYALNQNGLSFIEKQGAKETRRFFNIELQGK